MYNTMRNTHTYIHTYVYVCMCIYYRYNIINRAIYVG